MVVTNTIKVPFVDLKAQYHSIEAEMNEAIQEVLENTDFILGDEVEKLEQDFARYCEASYAIGVDSGTSALELALRAYGIGPGDEVITVANTFIATVLAISYVGATPVLVDVIADTHSIDPELVEDAINSRTKAIMPVHLYGQPVDMDAILMLAEKHGLIVIEDACQAHGAKYKGKRVGSLGHISAFSFYPGKNLGAYGDGGMVVTNDEKIAATVRMLRNYGQQQKYHHLLQGFNRRMDTLQAAVLSSKLNHLDSWNDARRRHAQLYNELLDSKLLRPLEPDFAHSVYHLYVIQTPDRDELRQNLQDKGIATGVHYPIPVHLQPAYQNLGYAKGMFPVTEKLAGEILSLPMYAELTPELIEYVAGAVNAFMSQH